MASKLWFDTLYNPLAIFIIASSEANRKCEFSSLWAFKSGLASPIVVRGVVQPSLFRTKNVSIQINRHNKYFYESYFHIISFLILHSFVLTSFHFSCQSIETHYQYRSIVKCSCPKTCWFRAVFVFSIKMCNNEFYNDVHPIELIIQFLNFKNDLISFHFL